MLIASTEQKSRLEEVKPSLRMVHKECFGLKYVIIVASRETGIKTRASKAFTENGMFLFKMCHYNYCSIYRDRNQD